MRAAPARDLPEPRGLPVAYRCSECDYSTGLAWNGMVHAWRTQHALEPAAPETEGAP